MKMVKTIELYILKYLSKCMIILWYLCNFKCWKTKKLHFKKAFLFCLEFHQLKLLLNHRMISLWSVYKSVIGTSSFKSLVNSFVNRAPVLLLPELGSNFNFLCLCTSACKVSQDKTHIWGKYHFLLRNDQLLPGIFNLKSTVCQKLDWHRLQWVTFALQILPHT